MMISAFGDQQQFIWSANGMILGWIDTFNACGQAKVYFCEGESEHIISTTEYEYDSIHVSYISRHDSHIHIFT